MEVMHVHSVLSRIVSILIGRSIGKSAFHTTASQPIGKTVRIVIPTIGTLRCWRPTKLRPPNHKSLVQQASCLQILQQARNRQIDLLGQYLMLSAQGIVLIPITMADLYKSHSGFAKPSC